MRSRPAGTATFLFTRPRTIHRALHRAAAVFFAVILIASLSPLTARGAGEAVKNPDTFVELQWRDVISLDPALAYDGGSWEPLFNIYDSLIRYSGASTDRFQPMLATRVPSQANGLISADGLTYTFPIRQGVRFHNGSVMTVDDVVYSIRRLMLQDPAAGPAWLLLSPLLGVDSTRDAKGKIAVTFADVAKAVSAQGDAVVFRIRKPFAPFLSVVAIFTPIMSRPWAAAHGDWDGGPTTWQKYNNPKTPKDRYQFDHTNGTGPFKLERWDRQAQQISLLRHEGYWRAPAALRRAVIQYVPEVTTRRLQLQQGDADLTTAGPNQLSQLRGLPGTVLQDNLPTLAVAALQFNYKINTEANPDVGSGRLDGAGIPPGFFADIHIRRGFAYAFDYAANFSGAYAGRGMIPHGPIVQGLLGYDPTIPVHTTDREKAIAEFKEAFGGRVWETGFKFTISVGAGAAARQVSAQIVKDTVGGLNPKFQIDWRPVQGSTISELWHAHKGTMNFLAWGADYPDPHNFAQPFLAANGIFPVVSGYRNPEADRLIDEAVGTADPAKRKALYRQLAMIAYNDLPYLFLVQPANFYVMRSWVHGWYYNPIFAGWDFYTISKQ